MRRFTKRDFMLVIIKIFNPTVAMSSLFLLKKKKIQCTQSGMIKSTPLNSIFLSKRKVFNEHKLKVSQKNTDNVVRQSPTNINPW